MLKSILTLVICFLIHSNIQAQAYLDYIKQLDTKGIEVQNINRKEKLDDIADWIVYQSSNDLPIQIMIVCKEGNCIGPMMKTWLSASLSYFGFQYVVITHAGTQPEKLRKETIKTLQKEGFSIKNNQVVFVSTTGSLNLYLEPKTIQEVLSQYGEMQWWIVQTEADTEIVTKYNSHVGFGMYYNDTKFYDGTPEQSKKYMELSKEIAQEMIYLGKSARQFYNEFNSRK